MSLDTLAYPSHAQESQSKGKLLSADSEAPAIEITCMQDMGRALASQGKYQEAIETLQNAVGKAEAYARRWADGAAGKGEVACLRYVLATHALAQTLVQMALDEDVPYQSGFTKYEVLQRAIDAYKSVVEVSLQLPPAERAKTCTSAHVGSTYYLLGQYTEAIRWMTAAIDTELCMQSIDCVQNLAQMHFCLAQSYKALCNAGLSAHAEAEVRREAAVDHLEEYFKVKVRHANQFCDECGQARKDENSKLLKCGSCRTVRYCTEQCQREGWKSHKELCPFFKAWDAKLGKDAGAGARGDAELRSKERALLEAYILKRGCEYICIHVDRCIYVYMYMYIYMYVCMYVRYTYTYIYMY